MSRIPVAPRRVAAPCLVALLLCLAAARAFAQQAIATPILPSADNFRDLAGIAAAFGGTGFSNPTANGGFMRTGVIYRTNQLGDLDSADSAKITALGIGRDIDLRTPSEISQSPDRVPKGLTFTNINIYGTPSPQDSSPSFTAPLSQAVAAMQDIYRQFVTDPVQRNGFRTVLLTLASDPYPDLYHCSAGKDRTGWTSAILQTIAGVDQATIMKDYLATNSFTAALINALRSAILATQPGATAATVDALLGVLPSYLQTSLDQAVASYGSMQAYLTQGLGLSQADIYVLRARMVRYPMLPGQGGYAGNAAAGAALLNALQDSPLSGRYTATNYYLQSAVDTGTLGGVQAQVGGQVHADAASFLLRLPERIQEATAAQAEARELQNGQTGYWLAGFGGNAWTEANGGAAASSEFAAGAMLGATRRFNDQARADFGLGYAWGQVGSADATVGVNALIASVGGRYAFSTLDAGPYLALRAQAGWLDYHGSRSLGGGLGTATGNTNGALYGGSAGLGQLCNLDPFTVSLQATAQVTGLTLGGFGESGSELALNVNGASSSYASLLLDLDISLTPRQLGDWTIAPVLSLGYERALSDPRARSTGTLYGLAVSQTSAYDSADLFKAGLGLSLTRDNFALRLKVNGLLGDAARSAGVGGQISLGWSF